MQSHSEYGSPFDVAARYGVPELHVCARPELGLYALVAIHNLRRGPALGGCRYAPYVNVEAALDDVTRLARAMSYKAAINELPYGGGKSVVLAPIEPERRAACFEALADFVEALGGRYIITEDSGTGEADMDLMATRTRHVVGTSLAAGGCGDPSPSTALGVRRGIEAAVKHRLGRDSLDGVHVAIQGVGNVGLGLARELKACGAILTVADRNDEATRRCAAETGAQIVAGDAIYEVEADVFAPCALGGAINPDTLGRLRTTIVAGAANNPLATPEMGTELHRRGILYAPDYVINAGGLTHVALWHKEDIRPRLLAIGDRLLSIFEQAAASGRQPEQVADSMAESMLTM